MKKGMTIPQFMNGQFADENFTKKVMQHINRNKTFYITVGAYTLIFICVGVDASAASQIDVKASAIYKKLVSVARWIIIVKAAFDIIQSATSGDFASVKTKLVGYIITFLVLLGLPWAFEQIDGLFQDEQVNG